MPTHVLPRSRFRVIAAILTITGVLQTGAVEAAAPPRPVVVPPPTAAPTTVSEPASTDWREIMMAPRITGNLRAVGIDPSDAKNIYVGTQEGTLAHSVDGGVTWEETEISPFLLRSPTISFAFTRDDYKAVDVFAGFHYVVGPQVFAFAPTYRRSSGQGALRAAPLMDPFLYVDINRDYPVPEPLLNAVAAEDGRPYEDIRRITICPGGGFPLLVATSTKLWGSLEGTSFVQLFTARDSAPINDVACSPANPNEVILTSGDGTFRSVDGGSSFDLMSGAFGALAASSLAFTPAGKAGSPQLVAAAGRDLWMGDSSLPDGMRLVTSATADIAHVAATSQSIWMATESGVQVTRDAGATWTSVDDLDRRASTMVVVLPGEGGAPERVAVLAQDTAFESTDGGTVFQPVFRAESRRHVRQLAALPAAAGGTSAWLLLTSGELWTSSALSSTLGREAVFERRRTSERRMRRMATLAQTIDLAVTKARLTGAHVEQLGDALKRRAWFPGMFVGFTALDTRRSSTRQGSVTSPNATLGAGSQRDYGGSVDFVWELPDLVNASSYNFSVAKKNLYELQKRLSYVVEDAYKERRQILGALTDSNLDDEQVITLQSRLDVLDVVLEQFTGEPQAL